MKDNRMSSTVTVTIATLGLVACLGASPLVRGAETETAQDHDQTSAIGPRSDRVLRGMSEFLRTATEFTFHADITYDSLSTSGPMIQYGATNDVSVRRPDRLHAEYHGDQQRRRVVFDGDTLTILDLGVNVYAVTEVPPQIDAALDLVFDRYDFSVPISDLVYSDPYKALTGHVQHGFWVGLHAVDGTPCHHLAFLQETIDWQIWIEAGPRPVPRKLLITYKDEPGSPQYTARLSGWDFHPRISDGWFEFRPPVGADQIEFLPVTDPEYPETEIDQ